MYKPQLSYWLSEQERETSSQFYVSNSCLTLEDNTPPALASDDRVFSSLAHCVNDDELMLNVLRCHLTY